MCWFYMPAQWMAPQLQWAPGETMCAISQVSLEGSSKGELADDVDKKPKEEEEDDDDDATELADVVAWLVINSMRSEQIQWSMLCLQATRRRHQSAIASLSSRGFGSR